MVCPWYQPWVASQCALTTGKGWGNNIFGQEYGTSTTLRHHPEYPHQYWNWPGGTTVSCPYCTLLLSPWNYRQRLCNATKPGSCTTDTQQAHVQQHSNLLIQCIEAWQQVQVLFMPSIITLQSDWSESMNRPPPTEDIPLFLPSQTNSRAPCPRPLNMIKFQLREGQAHDTLNDLHQGLWLRAYMLKFKDQFLHGQGANTWAQNCLKTLDTKINATATRYRVAYHALSILGPLLGQVGWKGHLHPLADDDICALSIGITFVQVREGATCLGFGRYADTVSRPQIMNQMMVSRKAHGWGYLNHNANLILY